MRTLYHHRTQGRGVEAIHIAGVCSGLRELGGQVEIVGPPGIDVNPNLVVSAETGRTGSKWGWIARNLPQWAFECMEMGYNLVAVPRLVKACRAFGPNLIYERYSLYNAAGVLAGAATGTPVILEVNDTAKVDRTRAGKGMAMPWAARWFERRIFRRAAGIVVVSGYLRDELIAGGIPAARIRVTPNAVDAAQFDPEREDGRRVRDRYALEGKVVVGFAGSFTKWHGVEFLLEACAPLIKGFPALRVLMVGDGVRRQAAEEAARALGIADRVTFTGKIPHSEMPAHLAAMDIGVMPASNTFGSPVKVFEYMAMGRPAVGPRYRPLEEAIDEARTGLIFQADDLEDLRRCLSELVGDAGKREAMGRAARQKVLDHHQWRHNAQAALDLLPENGRRAAVGGTQSAASGR
jgi:glycosyltransferase involved in cell wall biosynthesis